MSEHQRFQAQRASTRVSSIHDNLTLVPPHPSLNAASCANSSPNPNIKPLTNGNTRLIAAPRRMLKNVGGL